MAAGSGSPKVRGIVMQFMMTSKRDVKYFALLAVLVLKQAYLDCVFGSGAAGVFGAGDDRQPQAA